MSKKINTRNLSILLVLLLAIVLITLFIKSKKGERTFREQLFEIDTANITAIHLYPKLINFEEVRIERKGNSWIIIKKDKELNADRFSVENLLRQIEDLVALKLVANSTDKWEKYELSDSLATRVVMMSENKKLGELYVGKFAYNPQTQMGGSYVRVNDEKEVYSVRGFLQTVFDQDANSFRYNKLINTNKSDWTKLQFFYPADSSFTLSREESGWLLNGSVVDSVKTENYLNSIVNLNSRYFVDDDFVEENNKELYKLFIEGSNFRPIELKAYSADEENEFVITSSINPGAMFSGKKSALASKIFKGISEFIPTE